MDAAATAKVVELIIGTWPTGPRGNVWTRVVASMEPPAAVHQAWRNLARSEERMTVARFVEEHRRIVTTGIERNPPAGCVHCDGHGWREVWVERFGNVYSGVEPCSCPAGQLNVDVHDRILDFNRIELNRAIPGRAERQVTAQMEAEF